MLEDLLLGGLSFLDRFVEDTVVVGLVLVEPELDAQGIIINLSAILMIVHRALNRRHTIAISQFALGPLNSLQDSLDA